MALKFAGAHGAQPGGYSATRRDTLAVGVASEAPFLCGLVRQTSEVGTRICHRSAFTLIELLAVIVIIALVAALVLPILAKATTSARRLECLSRMKQWAGAFIAYAHDNDDWIPREGFHDAGDTFRNNWAQVAHARSQDVWYNALSHDVGKPPASSYALPRDWAAFYDRDSFFHCPSARFSVNVRTYPAALFSIAMNSKLIEVPLPAPGVPTIKFTRIAQSDPSRIPLFLDNLLDDEKPVTPFQPRNLLGQPASYASRFAGVRHGGMGNLAFADGHAASMAGSRVVAVQGLNAGFDIQPPVDVFWEPDWR